MPRDFISVYKSIVPEAKKTEVPICEDPIGALMRGIFPKEVVRALKADGWPEGDIARLFEEVEAIKTAMI